jgi:polysaccharide export outer membrane protein
MLRHPGLQDEFAHVVEGEGPMKRRKWQGCKVVVNCLLPLLCALGIGCVKDEGRIQPDPAVPRELKMVTLPSYTIEPPDILIINTLRIVPRPPYHVQPLDVLFINASNTLPNKPISGLYTVEPEGVVNLGLDYGSVSVYGLTVEQAQQKIQDYLNENVIKKARVQVSLAQGRGAQQIQGEHLVRMDGTIGLGSYGSVYVAGMTIDQARRAVEVFLSETLQNPEISLDVYSYNSKWYYIIQDRAGYGQSVYRLPITGKETVLDALSVVGGTQVLASSRKIWLARPNGSDPNAMQILPVNWPAITQGGSPATNYQLLPGDRLFVQSNPLIMANNRLNQFFSPIERVFGFTLLGTATVSSIEALSRSSGGGGTGVGTIR